MASMTGRPKRWLDASAAFVRFIKPWISQKICCGDGQEALRSEIKRKSIDFVWLEAPFNPSVELSEASALQRPVVRYRPMFVHGKPS